MTYLNSAAIKGTSLPTAFTAGTFFFFFSCCPNSFFRPFSIRLAVRLVIFYNGSKPERLFLRYCPAAHMAVQWPCPEPGAAARCSGLGIARASPELHFQPQRGGKLSPKPAGRETWGGGQAGEQRDLSCINPDEMKFLIQGKSQMAGAF